MRKSRISTKTYSKPTGSPTHYRLRQQLANPTMQTYSQNQQFIYRNFLGPTESSDKLSCTQYLIYILGRPNNHTV